MLQTIYGHHKPNHKIKYHIIYLSQVKFIDILSFDVCSPSLPYFEIKLPHGREEITFTMREDFDETMDVGGGVKP